MSIQREVIEAESAALKSCVEEDEWMRSEGPGQLGLMVDGTYLWKHIDVAAMLNSHRSTPAENSWNHLRRINHCLGPEVNNNVQVSSI